MFSILYPLGTVVAELVKSRARLEAEILLLRRQLNLALRHAPPRVRLRGGNLAVTVWMVWRLVQGKGQPRYLIRDRDCDKTDMA